MWKLFVGTAIVVCFLPFSWQGNPPHVIFIVANDLGWNDVGWHNLDMLTPNLDRYARKGFTLNASYVQPLCSPELQKQFYDGPVSLPHWVTEDPTEHHDLSHKHPDTLQRLKQRLDHWMTSLVPTQQPPNDAKANPSHFGGNWSPGWC